jgi:hypothetical protein
MYTRTTTTARRTPVRPASAASIRYARSLWTERVNDVDPATMQAAEHDQRAVSAIIDTLRNAPRKPSSVPATGPASAPAEPGMYRTADGALYRVQVSRESGRPYAKRLSVTDDGGAPRGRFEYAAGAVYRLSAAQRLSADECAAIGREFGVCVVCGAELSDPASVARGIGPVCATRV